MTKPMLILLVSILIIQQASTATTYSYPAPQLCPEPNELNLVSTKNQVIGGTPVPLNGNEAVPFDYILYVYTATNLQPMPVLVEKPTGANWKFTVNDNLLVQASQDCTGTSTMTYVDHIGPILILFDGTNHIVCTADLPTISSAASLTVTKNTVTYTGSTAPAATTFVDAYYYDPVNSKASVLFGNSISTQLYEVSSIGAGVNIQAWNGYIPRGMGGNQIIFNTSSNVILQKPAAPGAWTTFGGALGSGLLDTHDLKEVNVRQKVVKLYPLNGGNVVVALLETNRLSGKLYLIKKGNTVVSASPWTIGTGATTATLRVKFWTDGSRNLIAVTQKDLTWINLDATGATLMHAQIPLPSTINALTLPTILNIGVSRDKAVILTTNQAVVTLYLSASETIKVLYTQQVNGDLTDVQDLTALTTTDRRLFKLKLNCLCETIDKLVCYSATLNCVIIQKASAACGTPMDWTTIV